MYFFLFLKQFFAYISHFNKGVFNYIVSLIIIKCVFLHICLCTVGYMYFAVDITTMINTKQSVQFVCLFRKLLGPVEEQPTWCEVSEPI